MIDSNGRIPPGILSGATADLGSVQQCVSIKSSPFALDVNEFDAPVATTDSSTLDITTTTTSDSVTLDESNGILGKKVVNLDTDPSGASRKVLQFQGKYCLLSLKPVLPHRSTLYDTSSGHTSSSSPSYPSASSSSSSSSYHHTHDDRGLEGSSRASHAPDTIAASGNALTVNQHNTTSQVPSKFNNSFQGKVCLSLCTKHSFTAFSHSRSIAHTQSRVRLGQFLLSLPHLLQEKGERKLFCAVSASTNLSLT